jgi:hypothetical protein
MISVKTQKVEPLAPIVVMASKVHRIFAIDCSGSMSSELPRIRTQLKTKLPQLTNVGDTVSLIWFSSKGEAGILQEAVEIRSVTDFSNLNSAIDKWLRPVGLTGFVDPLKLVNSIAKKVRSTGFVSMFFITDGMDNQWTQPQIITAVKELEVDAVTFVEFGYYCNRAFMTKMAEEVGGTLLFNESFEQYDDTFTNLLVKTVQSGKKREVTIEGSAPLGYAFYMDGSNIISCLIENGKITLPEYIDTFGYVTDKVDEKADIDGLYIAAYTTAQRMLGSETIEILGQTGDVHFIEMFCNCFSKQDYSEFQAELLMAIIDDTLRLVQGQDFNAVPASDAFTVLDMLDMLANDKGNLFHPNSDHFNYERIGVKRDQKSGKVTDEEKDAILEKIKDSKNAEEMTAANKELSDLLSGKKDYIFVPEFSDGGYGIDLVFNEDRPNVSVRVLINGSVDIGDRDGLPKDFMTYVFRSYTMIKDGIKHSSMSCLPFELSRITFDSLQMHAGLLVGETWQEGKVYLLDAKKLPVINRDMAQKVSAKEFFEISAEMHMIQSEQKVYNTFYKEKFPKTSAGFEIMYGKENADWLKSIGITDFGGFNPPSVKGVVRDVYTAKEFQVKIAKYSTIPAINAKLIEKIEKTPDKLTPSEALCVTAIKEAKAVESFANYKEWLENRKLGATATTRSYILKVAKIKFAISVGHVWFSEFASMDENSMTVKVAGKEFVCTAELRDIEVEC